MQIALDPRFEDERRRFRLACACEQCAHFDARGAGRCAHGYPDALHRDACFETAGDGSPPTGVFCKEFELA